MRNLTKLTSGEFAKIYTLHPPYLRISNQQVTTFTNIHNWTVKQQLFLYYLQQTEFSDSIIITNGHRSYILPLGSYIYELTIMIMSIVLFASQVIEKFVNEKVMEFDNTVYIHSTIFLHNMIA